MGSHSSTAVSRFCQDVHEGLSAEDKCLSSRYFYDEQGDRLFQRIMHMPEYYLTDCEYEIFSERAGDILNELAIDEKFDLVELGAGDGLKTKILMSYFLEKSQFEYFPVDISGNVLELLKTSLAKDFPNLKVTPLNYEYFRALEHLNEMDDAPKLILFLGSNIGNFSREKAREFMRHLYETMNAGDQLLCGIDLKKDPETILQAYNDEAGITREFNLNLLSRINRELGGDIDRENFRHYPVYNPQSGECRSYLISLEDQKITLGATGESYFIEQHEAIHMETSRKYSHSEIEDLAHRSGFKVKRHFHDKRHFFTNSLWIKEA